MPATFRTVTRPSRNPVTLGNSVEPSILYLEARSGKVSRRGAERSDDFQRVFVVGGREGGGEVQESVFLACCIQEVCMCGCFGVFPYGQFAKRGQSSQ